MKIYLFIVATALIIFSFVWWTNSPQGEIDSYSQNELVADNYSSVPANELFMIGHWTNTPTASTTDLIRTYGFGGVIIMDTPENPDDIKKWITEWNEASEFPLLIAIDQEGGPVSRLKGNGFTETGQREIFSVKEAYELGLTRGKELTELGINMNFAPVLDRALDPNSFMYSRTFGDQTKTAELASAMIDGLAENGVIATPKHFPGHDDTSDDSHNVLPEVNIERSGLDEFTTPFRELIYDRQPLALMTAHVLFPEIDSLPVTLSPFFLTTYLRDTLQYKNVIITDDMSMDSVDVDQTAAEATVMAFEAGADIVLFAAEPFKAIEALEEVESVSKDDEELKNKLNLSVLRVRELREQI